MIRSQVLSIMMMEYPHTMNIENRKILTICQDNVEYEWYPEFDWYTENSN